MTLIDPTDHDLNTAFAEYIAGLLPPFETHNEYEETGGPDGDSCFIDVLRDVNGRRIHKYTRGVDFVLPWAKKRCVVTYSLTTGWMWKLMAWDKESRCHICTDESLARAIVIVLLRANGIKIEFTR